MKNDFSYDDALAIAKKVAVEKFNYSSDKKDAVDEMVRLASQIAAAVVWEYHCKIIDRD